MGALAIALGLAALAFPRVVFEGELLAGTSYLDKTLSVWEALARQPGSGWLPQALMGHDFGAAPDIAHGSPAWALWRLGSPILGSARAFSLLTPLLLALAGWGAWGQARSLGLSTRAAVLAGLVVGGNELMFETLGTIGVPATVAGLSLAGWAGLRLARRPGGLRLALFALAVGAALVGGHQQYALFGLVLVLSLSAGCGWGWSGRRGLAAVAGGALLGGALSLATVLPALALLAETGRARVQVDELLAEAGITLNGPMLWGLVSLDPALRLGDAVEQDPVYVGAVPVLLAVVGLASRRRPLAPLLGALALGVLLLSLEATGLLRGLLGLGLPGLSLFKTAEGRLLLLFGCVALLAGLGLDQGVAWARGRRWARGLAWGLVALTGLGLARMRLALEDEVFAENRVTPETLAGLRTPPPWHAGLAAADAGRFYLHRDRGEDSIENAALLWGGRELSGRAVLPPWRQLVLLHGTTALPALEQRAPALPETGLLSRPGLVGAAALAAVVLPARLDRRPAGEGWTRARWGDHVRYSRPPPPRARVVGAARLVPDLDAAVAALAARPTEHGPLLLEATEGPLATPGGGEGTVVIVEDGPARVVLDVESTGPGWLLLRDAPGAGWSARDAAGPLVLRHADVNSRAVRLPGAGRRRVTLVHDSPGRAAGRAVSGLALVLCGLLLAGGLWRRAGAEDGAAGAVR